MIHKVIARLNAPFPDRPCLSQLLVETVYVSLFVVFFLYVFNPFGLERMAIGAELAALGFGAVTFFCVLSFESLLRYVLKLQTDLPSWTLWRWLLAAISMVTWIAVGNFLLLVIIYPEWFQWDMFVGTLRATFMVGITPIIVSGFLIQARSTKAHQREADIVNNTTSDTSPPPAAHANVALKSVVKTEQPLSSSSEEITFDIAAGESLRLKTDEIVMIEAMQNYLSVFHTTAEQDNHEPIVRTLVRCTLSNAEKQLINSTVMRCHRSYMVNLKQVHHVSGNAQGLKLSLHALPEQMVPVSRRYIVTFKQRVNTHRVSRPNDV